MRWHYSRKMPVFKLACLGVWERGRWIGAIIFGCGATPEFGKSMGLRRHQVCELVHVALDKHQVSVSRVLSIAVKMLRKAFPNLRAIISFADVSRGHLGGIYQAAGWTYCGEFGHASYIKVNGVVEHPRTLGSRFGVGGQSLPWLRKHVDADAVAVPQEPKHRYILPLCPEVAARLKPQPYPKRAGSAAGGTAGVQPAGGGSTPTPALIESYAVGVSV